MYGDEEEEGVEYMKGYEKERIGMEKGWSEEEVRGWGKEEIGEGMGLIERGLIEFRVFEMSDEEWWV
ncbi:hypothetical protein, partial [Bacillus sp. WP8]|uniref:hypothetical protein n=1 Tax=Bacillus sp. WP8 TaxID=756828 RepID=UPI0037BFE9D8